MDASGGINAEIIVIDNNSSDNSVEFLKPLFPSVKFIALSENIGFGRANNIGIEQAKGEFLLILNPDTIIEEKNLRVMLDFMRSHPETGIAGCKVLNPDGSFQLACRRGYPTPWASFCKLFGLQKVFPKSRLFAKYNQTFLSIDETYNIDAVIGAYMFCRADAIRAVGGFDTDFFMYGEDLDLCWRVSRIGWKITYVHATSIIHFKGESTKRSSINELKHFYSAMEIFAKKHFGRSRIFFSFLKAGIYARSALAYLNKHQRAVGLILFDIASINFSLILATKLRFGEFFNFPPYAYPTVFIAVTLALMTSMTAVGEYFEHKHTIRKSVFGLMISFFILSSLTYFFKEFAFSRGILLMTIGFTILLSSGARSLLSLFDKLAGKEADKRVAILGINENSKSLIEQMNISASRNLILAGVIGNNAAEVAEFNSPYLGSKDYLARIIDENNIREVIITDKSFAIEDLKKTAAEISRTGVRFHIASEYDEVIALRIIGDITGEQTALPKYNLHIWRNAFLKRAFDITISLFLLTIGIPLVYLLFREPVKILSKIYQVLKGRFSFVGIYPTTLDKPKWKPGLIGLAHIGNPDRLSAKAIDNLNEYYMRNYSFSLDIDIILKYITRKQSGKANP